MEKLLLHVCCANCATVPIESLMVQPDSPLISSSSSRLSFSETSVLSKAEGSKQNFNLTLFWYNPNIYPHTKPVCAVLRKCLQNILNLFNQKFGVGVDPQSEYEKRLAEVKKLVKIYGVNLIISGGETRKWFRVVKDLENEPEGGKRCALCFQMRLAKTAETAKKKNFDYFGSTLTMGPQKRAETINFFGEELAKKYGLKFYRADFKKQDGFKKSLELSKKYNFYRQNYCGCKYSLKHKNIKT
jgi:predicted adenine nucleotide alpha hydrolase (AANH) superfamily ATPase